MVQLILVIVSILIILYIKSTSKNNEKFDEIFNKEYNFNKSIILLDFKERTFIDKVIEDIKRRKLQQEQSEAYYKEQVESINLYDTFEENENSNHSLFINMLENGYDEVEICKSLNIGRGEFLLLKSLYKR